MHIVVCVKFTKSATNVQVDPQMKGPAREGEEGINPFDEYAVEEAVRIKERIGGDSRVTALTMIPRVVSAAEEKLMKDVMSRGCDRVVAVADPALEGSDALATSHVLARAVRKISEIVGQVDLILCGKQTNDSDTGWVGPGLAGQLDLPHVCFVRKVEEIDEKRVRVHRMMADGTDVIEMTLPAVVVVVKEINEPRVPGLKGKLAAQKAKIQKGLPRPEGDGWILSLSAQEVGADPKRIGAAGAAVAVTGTSAPPPRPSGEKIDGRDAKEKAKKLWEKLKAGGWI